MRHRFPGFQFPAGARGSSALGIPVVYYISPQIWAWRAGRLKTIRAIADRVLVIFPFEEQIYRDGRRAGRVRRPPARSISPRPSAPRERRFCRRTACDAGRADRRDSARQPRERSARILCRISPRRPRSDPRARSRRAVRRRARAATSTIGCSTCSSSCGRDDVSIVEGETDAVLASADVALTASGTATVQTALHDVPMVIVYRLSPLTYRSSGGW